MYLQQYKLLPNHKYVSLGKEFIQYCKMFAKTLNSLIVLSNYSFKSTIEKLQC